MTLKLGFCPEGTGNGSIYPFNELFSSQQDISKSLEGVDAVVFWGGTDIHPSLYGENVGRYTYPNGSTGSLGKRDEFEWKAMQYCRLNKIPMIGVCRGAQLLTAFVGGKLIQHTNGHHASHDITTSDGQVFETTSCHHQMMYPGNVEHELLAWSTQRRSTIYLDGDNRSMDDMYTEKEPEVIFYPQVRGLAIQGHPEWANKASDFVKYTNDLISDLLITSMVS
jgi:GMP synthase-like glutamine amidotransferase